MEAYRVTETVLYKFWFALKLFLKSTRTESTEVKLETSAFILQDFHDDVERSGDIRGCVFFMECCRLVVCRIIFSYLY